MLESPVLLMLVGVWAGMGRGEEKVPWLELGQENQQCSCYNCAGCALLKGATSKGGWFIYFVDIIGLYIY